MRSRSVLILTVGLTRDLGALIAEGARQVWASVDVAPSGSVEDALKSPNLQGTMILVLGSAVAAVERARAAALLTPDGLPRWPVVICDDGSASDGLWFVPPAQRNVAGLADVLRLAATHHAALCEARRARGDLWTIARRISHEMRSPLGCILTSADVIRDELADVVPAAGALAQPIIDSAHEMMALLERLTLIARASALSPAPVALDMSMIVWAARERLAVTINETHAEVSEPQEWPPAVGQPEWLERIWQNLIANALQHAGPRPQIELGWKHGDGEIRFFVRDRGPGVAPEVVPMLLRPFHQLHLHDSGRGLGLAMVQRLVELQGGRSGYESVKPRGSCFFFTLPVGDVAAPP